MTGSSDGGKPAVRRPVLAVGPSCWEQTHAAAGQYAAGKRWKGFATCALGYVGNRTFFGEVARGAVKALLFGWNATNCLRQAGLGEVAL